MNHSQSLPEPSAAALAHSDQLRDAIIAEIANNGGAIRFKRYMEMALYHPGLGYYVAGAHKIGAAGDFITAPEISPLFARCVATQCAQVLQHCGGDILELGAGSGQMACDILLALERQQQLPAHYFILDVSPDLQQRQRETLHAQAPHLADKVRWITSLPSQFTGMIIGNEVLDAMPVDVFTQQGEAVYEHHVILADAQLTEQLRPADETLTAQVYALALNGDTPYTSELNRHLPAWFNSLSDCLVQGAILLIDYGYPRSEYYLPERTQGTLICHYQHLVNEAPLYYPGLQDITANVDFTAVAEAADAAGLHVAGFTSQTHFLSNTGLEQHFMHALEAEPEQQYSLAQQVRTLSLPSEMGERFKCIALSKNLDEALAQAPLCGFRDFDQRFRL